MKKIALTQGKFAIVDDEDYDIITQWKWNYAKVGYAARTTYTKMIKGKRESHVVYLHRFIMNPSQDMEVDHIDGDKLNNKRSNLRICISSQNKHNQRPIRGGLSKYKGVTWQAGKWVAQTKINTKEKKESYYLGRFCSEIDAALAYNKKAIELFGEFARLNVIGEGHV